MTLNNVIYQILLLLLKRPPRNNNNNVQKEVLFMSVYLVCVLHNKLS